MSMFSPPDPPDPTATANAQQGYNTAAAGSQAEINMVNQSTPYGSLNYTQTGTASDGTPMFSAQTQLSAPEQALFDATTGTQGTIARSAGQLATNLGPSLTGAPDLSTDAMTKQLLGWQSDYLTPYFKTGQSNLDAKLASQGFAPGSAGWNNAQRQLTNDQGGVMENAMAGDESQAFAQALQRYQAPISTLSTLLGEGAPANMNASLVNAPTEQIQPANYAGLTEQNYAQQNTQYGNLMNGLFGLLTAGTKAATAAAT